MPPLYKPEQVDEVIAVPSLEAFNTAREVATTEGLLIGISAGAAVWAALQLGKRHEMHGKNIVVVLPDSIERYLSLRYFD